MIHHNDIKNEPYGFQRGLESKHSKNDKKDN